MNTTNFRMWRCWARAIAPLVVLASEFGGRPASAQKASERISVNRTDSNLNRTDERARLMASFNLSSLTQLGHTAITAVGGVFSPAGFRTGNSPGSRPALVPGQRMSCALIVDNHQSELDWRNGESENQRLQGMKIKSPRIIGGMRFDRAPGLVAILIAK